MGKKDPTKPGVVYVVTDKRDPDRVRYVGRTVQGLTARSHKHWGDCTRFTTAFSNWLRKRLDRREDVVFTVVSHHPNVPLLNEAEKQTIAHYRALGQADLNLTDGGDGSCPGPWSEDRIRNHFNSVPRGENHPHHVLTQAEVSEIRSRATSEPVNVSELAREYKVTVSTMSEMLRNETWYDPTYDPSSRKYLPRKGDTARNRKLTGVQVHEIRELRSKKYISNRELGEMYGVTGDMIYRIVKNINWYSPDFDPKTIKPRGTNK